MVACDKTLHPCMGHGNTNWCGTKPSQLQRGALRALFSASSHGTDCSAADDDGTVIDGQQSLATGKWAVEIAELLNGGGVACRAVPIGAFTAQQIEKLLWASLLWLVCHAHGGITVRSRTGTDGWLSQG